MALMVRVPDSPSMVPGLCPRASSRPCTVVTSERTLRPFWPTEAVMRMAATRIPFPGGYAWVPVARAAVPSAAQERREFVHVGDDLGAGGTHRRGGVAGRVADHAHAGRERGGGTGRGILDDDAMRGRRTQPAGGE